MRFKKTLPPGQSLAVVAHPDDETIWLGGFISRHPELNWTILSLCHASDPDRRPKFSRACRHFKAAGMIADLPDDGKLSLERLIARIKKIIPEKLGRKRRFDYIFTHGQNGEYGHLIHRAAHQAVKSLVKEKKIITENLFCFNYKKNRRPTAKKNSDLIIHLNAREFKNKKAVMTGIYGFDPTGIDANLCANPEAFKIIEPHKSTNQLRIIQM